MEPHILETDNLHFTYPDGTMALKGVSVQIPRGRKIAFLGGNGAGKSTLFFHLNGLFRPNSGSVKYKGIPLSYRSRQLAKLRSAVGIVFQSPEAQLFSANIRQEISLGPLNLGLSRQEAELRVNEAMETAGISYLGDKPVHALSAGQKKLVCLAAVLAMRPSVLILDEPTAWLDPLHSQTVMAITERLNQMGCTLIISTHNAALAHQWPDYIFILREGVVSAQGEPEKVFSEPKLMEGLGFFQPWDIGYHKYLVGRFRRKGDN